MDLQLLSIGKFLADISMQYRNVWIVLLCTIALIALYATCVRSIIIQADMMFPFLFLNCFTGEGLPSAAMGENCQWPCLAS